MKSIKNLIERNKNTYIKHLDAPRNLINKYLDMYHGQSEFPKESL